MDITGSKSLLDKRANAGTQSESSQKDDATPDDDPISAYFKQRCESSRIYFEKHAEADCGRDSSFGLIDVDAVSLFDDGEENEMKHFRFSESDFDELKRNSLTVRNKKESATKMVIPEVESDLHKQRVLAQKALQRLSNKTNEMSTLAPKTTESTALTDISNKFLNLNLFKRVDEDWLGPSDSPKTPRYFNDELSSCVGENENLPTEVETKANEANTIRQSLYAKKVNSMHKELLQLSVNSDMEFERQTKEEQINRFEEDEKKFKLESSGVLHNSQISQFSGIAGGDIPQCFRQSETSGRETENRNLSIGQFFNLRSHRISSLVGSSGVNFESDLERQTEAPRLSNAQPQTVRKSECAFPVMEAPHLDKPKVRRCVSTNDLEQIPEIPKTARNSNDSCSTNSSVMIQEILAEMESGLSGSEIYEKLLKSYGRRTKKEKENNVEKKSIKASETRETPKSSKVQERKDLGRSKKELNFAEACKESKNLPNQSSNLCTAEEKKERSTRNLRLNETSPPARHDKLKKIGTSKGFCSSTPKTQDAKSEINKFRKNCGKVIMGNEDWEPPRVNSIKPTEMNKSECSEENEKTILINSTGSSELNVKKTFTVEDTIVAGDLTVLSQRIEEMKRDSVCIVRSDESEEPVLLEVIQKLAHLPKGSLDCSALTPLLRDQFPELLSNFPTSSENPSAGVRSKTNTKVQDALIAVPGSWVKLPGVWGLNEKVYAYTDVEKTVAIPFVNSSQKWLLVGIESVDFVQSRGKTVSGEKKSSGWWIKDLVSLSIKETIIPPDNSQSLKVSFVCKIAAKLELMLTFGIRELMGEEVQTRNLRLLINSIHPENYINVLPNDPINFGCIADQCFDQAVVQISFEGICELPLTVFIQEDEPVSGHFILKPSTGQPHEKGFEDNICHHFFNEGEKQTLELRIVFRPSVLLKEDSKTQDFKAILVLMLGSKTDSGGILRKIPIKGSVGFAKFLCNSTCSPLVFRATEEGQSVTRSYPLKNVGSLPIDFSILIFNEDLKTVEGEDVFVFPKSFYLPRDEVAEINITFNARGTQNCTKRYLMLQVKPNGKIIYEVELIGIIATSEGKSSCRTSGVSVSTRSTANSESAPVRLLTTSQSLSWTAVALEKESRQTFQIKNLSSVTSSVRVGFERNLDAFKLVNENGEKVQKLRKVLKPDSPCSLTVIFRPDIVGAHNTYLTLEMSHTQFQRKVFLNGIGGIPNLVMRNVSSDLNGCKIFRLQHSRDSSQLENVMQFTNEGRIPAFLLIKLGVNDFSLGHELAIFPSCVVIQPDSSVSIKISQKLKNDDLQKLLSDREIRKIATLCVVTGDEPSRLRLRTLVVSGMVQPSERLDLFTGTFFNEKEIPLKNFTDLPGFENEFLKSLKVSEVAVVVERNSEITEPSILEETTDEFISFMSDQTVINRLKPQNPTKTESQKSESGTARVNAAVFSAESLKTIPHNRVTKWLETLDCV